MKKIRPGFISLDEAGHRHRIRKHIGHYTQIVANRHQVMDVIAGLSAEMIDLAIEHGQAVRQLRAFRLIQAELGTLAKMEEQMTKNIDSFIIEHGYFVDQNA